MALLRCHDDCECNKEIFILYSTVVLTFYDIFTHADVVNAQTWEVPRLETPVEPP